MRLTRLRTRLILAYAGLLLLGFALLGFLAGAQISRGAYEDFARQLQSQVALVARSLLEDVEHLAEGEEIAVRVEDQLRTLATSVDGRLVLLNPQGEVWIDSAGLLVPGTPMEAPEFSAAARGGVGYDQREDGQGISTAYTAAPLSEDGTVLAIIQLSTPIDEAQGVVWQRWLVLTVGVVLLSLLALVVSLWLAASLTHPLEQVRVSALQVAQGDFAVRLPEGREDELGEVARAFNHMAAQVQAMLEEQRAFTSYASHELRTPLTTIRLRSEALRAGQVDSETSKRYIQEIDEEVGRLGGLVEDLILLARLDAGRVERSGDVVDPLRLVRALFRDLLPIAESHALHLTLDAPDVLPMVQGNANHLRVVWRNLLTNALNYTPPGGDVRCTLALEGNDLLMVVADTGEGVASADLPHLFKRFYRADRAHSRAVPGAGLGLSLVELLVHANHGRITVESAGLGAGTTARVWWPVTERGVALS